MDNEKLELLKKYASSFDHIFTEESSYNYTNRDELKKHRQKILDLRKNKFIEYDSQGKFSVTDLGHKVASYNSWEDYQKEKNEDNLKKTRKDSLDYNLSKWKYYAFWPLLFIAFFGGFGDAYNKIFPKKEVKEKNLITRQEMEKEISTLRILILNQKSLDSLNSSKIKIDSLKL